MSGGMLALTGSGRLNLGLSMLSVGRGAHARPVGLRGASVDRNELRLGSSGLREWLANGPLGLEQSFFVTRRPPGNGPLAISQLISGAAIDKLADGSVAFSWGAGTLLYTQLVVSDQSGARVPARLAIAHHRLLIEISDARATYPLRIDPTIEQVRELTASDGSPDDRLGSAVAVSGSTLVLGAPDHGAGAVYVFTLPASGGWADATQTAELTVSDGTPDDCFGCSVAISGQTIVVGAPGRTIDGNAGQGSVYVYTEPPGGWASSSTPSAQLIASDGEQNANLGYSVAISGPVIVAGAFGGAGGSAYVFSEPAAGWASAPTPTPQTAELAASDGGGDLGYSVAISGPVIAAGAPDYIAGPNASQGAVYVFSEPPGGWSSDAPTTPQTQAGELTSADGTAYDNLGFSVAISGPVIVAGAPGHAVDDNENAGAVYVYAEPPNGWSTTSQATTELTASDAATGDQLGLSVAISGATVAAAAPGSGDDQGLLDLFSEPSGSWAGTTTQSAELETSDGQAGDQFGFAVAVSGSTIVAGAPGRASGQGAAYVFESASSQTMSLSLSPASIPADGTSTSTATVTVDDLGGGPVSGDTVSIQSSGGQQVGPVTAGSTPGTYQATITSTSTVGQSTITATDSTANANATATLTQTAPSPIVTPNPHAASNQFTITASQGASDGTIGIQLDAPGSGTIEILGTHSAASGGGASSASYLLMPGWHRYATCRATLHVAAAGVVKVTLHLNHRAMAMLRYARHHGWPVHINVSVAYRPTGGTPRTHEVTVLVLKAKPS